ncbi:hypothetical protein QBC43DRAFT_331621 [Cladorrhinum sp. PSN259]|nr:hypothetical protein QBC43DRAFT_331621 [Cladorrhinum sp. PSN259]
MATTPLLALTVQSRPETDNKRLRNLTVDNFTSEWSVGHDQAFQFSVKLFVQIATEKRTAQSVARSDLADPGNLVGLVQTLVSSTRVATYEGGGTLTITPSQHLPCLDADSTTAPWYNSLPGVKTVLPTPGSRGTTLELAVSMDDNPSWNLPTELVVTVPPKSKGDKAKLERRHVTQVVTEEKFLLSLYNRTQNKIIAQWTWSYSNVVQATAADRWRPKVVRTDSSFAIKRSASSIVQVPLAGPVAGENGSRRLSPGYSYIPGSGW